MVYLRTQGECTGHRKVFSSVGVNSAIWPLPPWQHRAHASPTGTHVQAELWATPRLASAHSHAIKAACRGSVLFGREGGRSLGYWGFVLFWVRFLLLFVCFVFIWSVFCLFVFMNFLLVRLKYHCFKRLRVKTITNVKQEFQTKITGCS